MAKQVAPVEVNSFVAGLVSDAGPLTFPDNASLQEDNFVLNQDGSRNRRFGMDFEGGGSEISTNVSFSAFNPAASTNFKWENAGGIADKDLLVVQFGNELKFFDLSNPAVSSDVLHTETFNSATASTEYSYAVVDGLLVVVNGESDINIFSYESPDTITKSTDTLSIRDFFGVEDVVDEVDLYSGNNITTRPSTKTDNHLYNLRNQSWAVPRKAGNNEYLQDPIETFREVDSSNRYPSNSDTVTQSLYADANDGDDRNSLRFFAKDLISNPIGSTVSPSGHYIIDALNRGASREDAYQKDVDDGNAVLEGSRTMLEIESLPSDITPGGATVVAQYAGRVWYGGFGGEVTDGDNRSPRMSSYLLFSQQVEEQSAIVRCYQEGDPTSEDSPDTLKTDGGFLRIDEAYGIKAMVNLGSSLFVIAANGVWRILGTDSDSFTADAYSVVKVSDRGAVGAGSVVEVEGSLFYWGQDGIYNVARNEFGDWSATNLTENVLQKFYNAISSMSKVGVKGQYDSFDKKIRWIYDNQVDSSSNVKELVLDKTLGAFYTNSIFTPDGTSFPKVVSIFETNPFQTALGTEDVEAGGDPVTVVGDQVTVSASIRQSVTREVGYVAITELSPRIKYKFCRYQDSTFRDWKSLDGVGVDAAAFMVTGYISGGDFQRGKQVTYMTTYFKKTEDGFEEDESGDFVPTNQSSCKVQFQWDWTNSENSNRWTTPREFYRHNRLYFPPNIDDEFDDGHSVVASRDKVRGSGRVLSVKFSTSPLKDLHLYGWSMIVGVRGSA